ncbi:MAG: ubiquinone/menaquinone biosynthesis methyltransferase [Thermodesulfobacteriota bacterium]
MNNRRPETRYPALDRLSDAERVLMVKEIFTTVTGAYDFLNRLLSLRRDVAWRRRAALEMRFFRTNRLLDLATGTCDLAVEAARKHPGIRITGVDLVSEMIALGRAKIRRQGLHRRIHLLKGDAVNLPFADDQFDAAAVAFGIRNMPDRIKALKEMVRVTVPEGRILVLEMALPRSKALRMAYRLYLNAFLPRLARLFSPNPEAYYYLADSIMNFPEPGAFTELMVRAGLEQVKVHPLTFGITYLHVGRKPAALTKN